MKKQIPDQTYGVIGLGRFGTALVKTLAAAGKEVIAVDKDEEKVKAVRGDTEYAFVVGALTEQALRETGMHNCGTVTICIGERVDVSIMTTMQVLKLGVPHVIADVVYPEADMAVRIGKRLINGNMLDYVTLGDNVEVRRIVASGHLVGHSVKDLNLRRVYGINIIAVEHEQHTDVEFSPDYVFTKGDTVSVIGKTEKLDFFERAMQK